MRVDPVTAYHVRKLLCHAMGESGGCAVAGLWVSNCFKPTATPAGGGGHNVGVQPLEPHVAQGPCDRAAKRRQPCGALPVELEARLLGGGPKDTPHRPYHHSVAGSALWPRAEQLQVVAQGLQSHDGLAV